jgi:hypothetical protein
MISTICKGAKIPFLNGSKRLTMKLVMALTATLLKTYLLADPSKRRQSSRREQKTTALMRMISPNKIPKSQPRER